MNQWQWYLNDLQIQLSKIPWNIKNLCSVSYCASNFSGFAVQNIHRFVGGPSLVVTGLHLEILLITRPHQGLCFYGSLLFAPTL